MENPLRFYSEKIAAKVIGCQHEEVTKALSDFEQGIVGAPIVGFDIIVIMELVEMIMTMVAALINDCPEARVDEVRRSLQAPRIGQRILLRLMVRDECRGQTRLIRRKANSIRKGMLTTAAEATVDEVDDVIIQCRKDLGSAA